MTETKIGTVTHFFNNIHVAGVILTDGELHTGDTIHILGHTSDFMQKVGSMEMDHKQIEAATTGDDIGISVIDHAREHDAVYLVT